MELKSLKQQQSEKKVRRVIVEDLPSDCDSDDDSYWYSSTDSEGYDSPVTDPEGDSKYENLEEGETQMIIPKIPKESRYRLTMWTAKTHYDVVKEVAKF